MSVFHTITRIVVKHCSRFRFQSDRIQLPRVCYRLTVSSILFFFPPPPFTMAARLCIRRIRLPSNNVYYSDLQNRGSQCQNHVVVRDVIFCRPCLSRGVSRTERVSFVRIYIFAVPYSG